jgi:hypothetical protein
MVSCAAAPEVADRVPATKAPLVRSNQCLSVGVPNGNRLSNPAPQLCLADPVLPPSSPASPELAAWLASLASAVLDRVDGADCPEPGCIRGTPARLHLLSDGFPTAAVMRASDHFDIVISVGMADFLLAAAQAAREELEGATPDEDGLGRWMERIHAASSAACTSPEVAAAGAVRGSSSHKEMESARSAFEFVLAHELAHVAVGSTCGSSSLDALSVEKACDAVAYRHIRDLPLTPVLVVLWLTAMHHYEQLLSLRIKSRVKFVGEYTATYPARDWTSRAAAVLASWGSDCQREPAFKSCPKNWQSMFQSAGALTRLPLPQPCSISTVRQPTLVSPPNKEAADCVDLSEDEVERANYAQNARPNLVSLNLPYRNSCPRPVQCVVRLGSGTVPRSGDHSDWRAYRFVERSVALAPGETRRVAALLRWFADEERMPSVRYPHHDERRDWLTCSFTGRAKPRKIEGPLCTQIDALITDARKNFAGLVAGRVPAYAQGGLDARAAIPSLSKCTVWPAGQVSEAKLRCDALSTPDPEVLQRGYDTWRSSIRRCLDGALWNEKEGTFEDSDDATRYTEFRASARGPAVEVELRRSLVGVPHELEVSVVGMEVPFQRATAQSLATPAVEVKSLDDAIDRILVALTASGGKPMGRIEIAHDPHAGYDEYDKCYRPDYDVEEDTCRVEWRCKTQDYFRPQLLKDRFDALVARLILKFRNDAEWIPRNSDRKNDWAPYGAEGAWSWTAYSRRGSLEIRAEILDSKRKNMEVYVTGDLPKAACAERAE